MGGRRMGSGLAALACLVILQAHAQQPPPVFRADVRLVRLLVSVKDLQGRPVGSLQPGDFTILDNGVPQRIAVFERYTEQPLSIALLVDTSASIAKDLRIALASVKRFLAALLAEGNPADEIALFTFNWEVRQLSGYARDLNRIDRLIHPLKAEAGTSLYDAVFFASQSLQGREGRHVLVIVTDGGDTTSHYTYQDALEAAHRADAPVYSIVLTPIQNEAGRNLGGENALAMLAASTGGRTFFASAGSELDEALREILTELRTQYLLAYYPKNVPASKNRFHTIRVNLARDGLRALTRSGYYGDQDRE